MSGLSVYKDIVVLLKLVGYLVSVLLR